MSGALGRSASVPSVSTLGMNLPRDIIGTSQAKHSTLKFRGDGPIDTWNNTPATAASMDLIKEIKNPGWRCRFTAPRELPPVDRTPKNMKWPRKVPAWLKHEKQCLRFYAYFQESVVERWDENCRYRSVIIIYSLEDGTIQMEEPKVENSGIPQGRFLKRHMVPRADGMGYLGPTDFIVGEEITIYGRTYQITGCDRFTRWFFEELGMPVAEDESQPQDMWQKSYTFQKVAEKGGLPMPRSCAEEKKLTNFMLGQPVIDRKLVQFLQNDRKVLRFKGFWDDDTMYGNRIYFTIHYYLSDNTMEVNEAHARNSGRWQVPVFYKRGPILKENRVNAYPGMLEPDPEPYEPKDLVVGGFINLWGRTIHLYDCDDFTQKFYSDYLGHDQKSGCIDVTEPPKVHQKLCPPPHNGIGYPEDSLMNCEKIVPKPAKKDLMKMMVLAGELLRFEAILVNGEPEDENRKFVIGYYPVDDEMACWELAVRNSGHMGGKFAKKERMRNPDTGRYFDLNELAVGHTVTINAHPLHIIRADEHTLRYLEAHANDFPHANALACAMRLAPCAGALQDPNGISPDALKSAAGDVGVHLLDHEVITLLRHFSHEGARGGGRPLIDGPAVSQVIADHS
eukprot:TRINITY_DN2355_c0_g1_i1.p1 TRINITY_DN2355_c0_g1~~TRINITY_DN2355_c0_g1_i1.p1  ORF type:complete len:621 (+),score=151.53 TRINITY_DN2355_c0_g1_i1:128-1990(+)